MFLRLSTIYKSIVSILFFSMSVFSVSLRADGVGCPDEAEGCFFAFPGELEQEDFSRLCQKLKEMDRIMENRKNYLAYGVILGLALRRQMINPLIPLPMSWDTVLDKAAPFIGGELAQRFSSDVCRPEDFRNSLTLYGSSSQGKAILLQKCAQETGCVLLKYNWQDIKKKYAHKDSKCLEEFFVQARADFCEKVRAVSNKNSVKMLLFIDNADELIDCSTVVARNFHLEMEKRKDSSFLFVLATNRTTIWTGNILEGLVGKAPMKCRYAINQLKEAGAALKAGKPLPKAICKNRLLLYGPPGNGKTVMAQKIAEQAGAHYVYVNTPELIDKFQGKTAAAIKAIFVGIHEHADKNFEPVAIGLDEIDAIAAQVSSENRADILAALQVLWHELDVIQNDSRFFVIGMTNVEALHETLKTRFGNNIEKISAPDKSVRKSVLQLYKKVYTGEPWNEKILKKLVDNTENEKISIRFLEDYVREVYMVAKNDNDGVITDELAWDIFKEMKAKYVEDWKQWAKRQAQTRENWDNLVRVGSAVVVVAAHAA